MKTTNGSKRQLVPPSHLQVSWLPSNDSYLHAPRRPIDPPPTLISPPRHPSSSSWGYQRRSPAHWGRGQGRAPTFSSGAPIQGSRLRPRSPVLCPTRNLCIYVACTDIGLDQATVFPWIRRWRRHHMRGRAVGRTPFVTSRARHLGRRLRCPFSLLTFLDPGHHCSLYPRFFGPLFFRHFTRRHASSAHLCLRCSPSLLHPIPVFRYLTGQNLRIPSILCSHPPSQ